MPDPSLTPRNPAHANFKCGLKPTPAHRIAEAVTSGQLRVYRPEIAAPSQVAMVPQRLSMWLNDQDGDCVTAEEAFAIAAYSTWLGLPEIFIPDASVLAFCNHFGVLNGADLLSVMEDMQLTGLVGSDGRTYRDGLPSVVDLTNESALQAALATGPVKLGIMSSALPDNAGHQNGWYAFNPGPNGPEDHCTSLCGFGPIEWLARQLGVVLPLSTPATAYLLFTWSSIGLVSYAWLKAACAEAYVRTPTTLGLSPTPPPPKPPPPPPPPSPPGPVPGEIQRLKFPPGGVPANRRVQFVTTVQVPDGYVDLVPETKATPSSHPRRHAVVEVLTEP